MKQLKKISLWRKIAIVLCFALAIGAGVTGALIPQMNGAFAEDETRAASSLSVTWSGGSIEKNVTSTEADQLKPYLRVTDDEGNVVPSESYDVSVTYNDINNAATVTVTGKADTAYATLTANTTAIPAVDAKFQGLRVGIPATIGGETVTLNGDGYYQLAENKLIYFTDMEPQDVLDKLDVSVKYQHIAKRITYTENADGTLNFASHDRDGLTVMRLLVNNSSFEIGTQAVGVTVLFQVGSGNESQSMTEDVSIKFAERKAIAISAELNDAGKKATIYPFTDLGNYLNVIATYNDGKSGIALDKREFSTSALFPSLSEQNAVWIEKSYDGSGNTVWQKSSKGFEGVYDESDILSKDLGYTQKITVTYNGDPTVSALLNNDIEVGSDKIKNSIAVSYAKPYQFTITGTVAKQTAGQPFDFSGLTLTIVYLEASRSVTGTTVVNSVYNVQVPLDKVDREFLRVTYGSDESEANAEAEKLYKDDITSADAAQFAIKSYPRPADTAFTVPTDADKKYARIEFVYSGADGKRFKGGSHFGELESAGTPPTEPGKYDPMAAQWSSYRSWNIKANFVVHSVAFGLKDSSTVGAETYSKPSIDTKAKYLVDVEGIPQHVSLDYRLREALRTSENPESILRVSVTNLKGESIEGVWHADYANEDYYLLFSDTDLYTVKFELINDVWETGKKTISYTVPVQKRYLDVTYGSKSSGNVSGEFSTWVTSLEVNFTNRDNGAVVDEGLPAFDVKMYASGSTEEVVIGRSSNGGKTVVWDSSKTELYDKKTGIYFLYASFDSTEYYYGSGDSAYAIYQINLGQTYEETYQRHSIKDVISAWQDGLNRAGATEMKLYRYDGSAPNKVGDLVSANPEMATEILHAGNYTLEYRAQGGEILSYDTVIIRAVNYFEQTAENTLEIGYDGNGVDVAKETQLREKAAAVLNGIYPELSESALQIVVGTSTTTDLSVVKNVGNYQARFETRTADADEEGDYNLPYIYVNFKITPHVVTELSLTATDGLTSVEYTGNEIAFNLKDGNGDWLDIYKENLIVIMNSATLVSGRAINSAFYFVNGNTDGTVRVALAGTYKVGVTFNQNVVSAAGEAYKELTVNVTRATLSITIAGGKAQIEQEASYSIFALQANKLVFTGVGNDNAGTASSAGFRPASYKVYNTYSGGKLSGLQASTVPYREAAYYLHLTGVTANNYRYPLSSGSLLADFTYMENYVFVPGDENSPNSAAVFELKVLKQVLKPLERKDGSSTDTPVSEIYDAGRAWNMLDYFTTTEPVSTYAITVTNTKTNLSVTAIADGADAGKFNLNAGSYTVEINTNGTNVWEGNVDAAVTFDLTVEKQAVTIEEIGLIRNTYNGAEHIASLGGTSAYWQDLSNKGVSATVSFLASGAADGSAKTTLTGAFVNGQLKWTNAGSYFITFDIPADNYYWADGENKDTDKTDFDETGVYTTAEQQIAEIARMQITAPALGASRLTQTGTARTLPAAFTSHFTITQGNITVTYQVEYATAGELQETTHTHGTFGSARPADDDNTQGVYAIRLTVTGAAATNFAWVRNASDIDYISYTNAYDIQGFETNTHVAILHYVTVTQTLDIQCDPSKSFYYGGFLGDSDSGISEDAMTDLAGHMFCYTGTIPSGANYSYSYVNASGVSVDANAFKSWNAGMYIGTVNITFPDTEYLPLSFNVAITVDKLPVGLTAAGSGIYGSDPEISSVGYADNSKEFIGFTGELKDKVNVAGVTKDSAAQTYAGAQYFVLTDDPYFDNYAVTFTADSKIVVSPQTIVIGFKDVIEGSIYGDELTQERLLSALSYNTTDFPDGSLLEIVSIALTATGTTEGRINANEEGYGIEVTSKSGNYRLEIGGSGKWSVAKKEAYVTVDLELVYGEEVRAGALAENVKTKIEGFLGSDDYGTGETASYTVDDNGHIVYASGFTNNNYHFVDVSSNESGTFGKVSYKPLGVSVTIGNAEGDYYKPQRLTYTLTVNSVSSYDAGEKVTLTAEAMERLGVAVDGSAYGGNVWSQGVNGVDFNGKAFVVTTGAYDHEPEDGATGATANAGTYAIVGMTNSAFAENYNITFTGAWATGSNSGKAGVYTVNKVGGNDKFMVSTDSADVEKNPDKIVIIIKPAGTASVQARKAVSLAAAVADTVNGTTLPYDETYRTLLTAEVSGVQDGYTVLYNLEVGENPQTPAKTDSGWTSIPPTAIDAGIYTIYYYVKMASPNYDDSDIFSFTVTITKAENTVETPFNFSNGKAFASAGEADRNAAWVYGLYSETAEDGFNIMGDQAIAEFVAKYQRGATFGVSLYSGEEPTALYTAGSATAVFNYMFNNGDGKRFNAGVYRLVFTVTAQSNANGETNYSNLSVSYYFTVAKRAVSITAGNQTVVYGESATGLAAAVTGLVRNNYHASETPIDPESLYTLTVSGYTAGVTDVGATGVSVTVTLVDNATALLGDNYDTPTLTDGTLAVVQRRVVVKIGDMSSTYGDEAPNNTFGAQYVESDAYGKTYQPLGGHVIIDLKVKAGAEDAVTSATNAGRYPIYAVWNTDSSNGGSDKHQDNYEVVFVNCSYGDVLAVEGALGNGQTNAAGTYTVNKKVIDVEWSAENGSSYVYNGTARTFSATANVKDETVNLTVAYKKGEKDSAAPINAGEYKVIASFNEEDYPNYTTGGSSITVTITKATATVTANDASVLYGNALSEGTGYGMTVALPAGIAENKIDADEKSTLEAFNTFDKFLVYTDRAGTALYVAGTGVGSYQIVIDPENVIMTNFELVPVAGVFTVNKRTVTVTVGDLEREYGGNYLTQADIDLLVEGKEGDVFQVDGDWQDKHDWSALGIVLSVDSALNAGEYQLTATSNSANYDITFASTVGKLTITKKRLTVSASATVVYGEDWNTATVTPVWNGFVDGESYASLLAIAGAMSGGNKPVTGSIGYTTDYANKPDNASTVGSNPSVTPVISNIEFLNYTVTVDEKTDGVNLVKVTPRAVSVAPHADYVYGERYDEAPIVFGNLFGSDKIAVSYAYTKDGAGVTGLGDAGNYSVTATLLPAQGDAEVNKNYAFANGASTSEAVTVTVVPKAVDVNWEYGVFDLDANPNAINYLEGYNDGIMSIAEGDFKHSYFNESDGTTTVKNVGLIGYGDGRHGITAEIGTYTLTLTLKNSVNYRWVNSEENTYTVIFSATSIEVTLEVTVPQDVTFGDNAQVTATVANGNVKDVAFTYYPVSDKDVFAALVGKIKNGTIRLSDLQGIEYEETMPKNAGNYIVRAYYQAQDNENKTAEKFAAFEIKPLAVSVPKSHGAASQEFNGGALVFEVTGYESYMSFAVPNGMVGTAVGNTVRFTAKDVFDYQVTFELLDSNHVWKDGEEAKVIFSVTKSKQEITLSDAYTFVYGDEIDVAPAFKYTADEAVILYFTYSGDPSSPQGDPLGNILPSNAGIYYVVVSVEGTDNYDGESAGAIVVVEKKEVKVSVTVNVPYGQTVAAGDIYYTLAGLANGETEDNYVTVNLSVLASGLTFGEGAGLKNAGRYKPTFATAQTEINAYTGATANGLVGFSKRGAADNYYFTADANSIVIVNKLAVSVVIGNASGTFGSSPQFNSGITLRWADSVANNNIPAADKAKQDAALMELLGVSASSFYCTATDTSDAGSYPIKVTRWSSDNYNVTFVDGSYEVLPANIFVEWTTGGGTYGDVTAPEITKLSVLLGGSLQDVTNSTFGQNAISKLSFLFTDTTGVPLFDAGKTPANAGEYYVELVLAADGKIGKNYILSPSSSAQRRFSVGKLVIEVEDLRVDYGDDGMKLAYKNGNVIIPTLVENEEISKYFTVVRYDEAKTVGTYYMTVVLKDFQNVQWSVGRTAEYRLAFNVTKAKNHIVGSIQMEGWTYGDEGNTPSVTLANNKDISDGVDIVPVFEYSANNGADWTTVAPTAAGSYLVRATANGTTNVEAFVSPSVTPFTIARRAIAKPQIEVSTENNSYTGNVLLANVSGFDQSLMMFTYVGNFTVDGNSIALTALNAGTYTLVITLTDSNYIWADGDGSAVYEQTWTVAPKRLEKPTGGKNSFVVNGGIITYTPENFDPATMAISGNAEGHGGTFTAEISIIDPANYVWDDGTVDSIQIEWTIVGINTVYKALMGVLGSIAGLAVLGGAAQFVLYKRKQKREAEMDGDSSEQHSDAESEGGEQA